MVSSTLTWSWYW